MLKINKERDDLLTDYAIGMLKDFYMRDHENSPQEAYARASKAWSTYKGNLNFFCFSQQLFSRRLL